MYWNKIVDKNIHCHEINNLECMCYYFYAECTVCQTVFAKRNILVKEAFLSLLLL